ncbi:MAG TPA: LamG-like jellyroll fold domain-containing protein, partial [Caldilineaceae bacterium]|nr:LamG-like jellyroll fold domain-containing protein [Caldilineaceae bacterium]
MHLRPVVRLALALGIVFLWSGLAFWVWAGVIHAQGQTILYVRADADDGLVAHWQFDQSGGTVTTDFRNLMTATVNGAANPFTTTVVFPTLLRPNPRALSLNPGGNPAANDDYLTVNDAYPDLNRADNFTVAAWVRREANDDYDPIYDSGVQTGTWWVFIAGSTIGNANKLGFGLHNMDSYYSSVTIPADGQWRHLAVVVENGPHPTVRFFVNGVAAGTATVNHEIPVPYGVKHIGAFSEPGETAPFAHFDGAIDELRFYDRALTAEEVQRLGLFRRSCVTTGASWAQAFPDLHCALEIAAPNNQIWVAKGRYYPRVTSGSTDTFVTFGLKNSVAIYGNFDGTESSLEQRPSLALADVIQGKPASFLTADFQGNDDLAAFTNTGDNLSTILNSTGANSAARLDGFVIQGARALDGGGVAAVTIGGSPTYENLIFWANRGAQAMRNTNNSSPSLQNVIFYQNLESTSLAGRDGVLNNVASQPRLTNVQFISNTARIGGAMVNDGGTARLANVQFLGNTASNDGGAIALLNGSMLLGEQLTFRLNRASNGGALYLDGNSTATITNTHFLENRASADGGALYNEGDLTVAASSFLTNVAVADGGGILNAGDLTLHDSRFAGNEAAAGGGLLNRGTMEASRNEFQRNKAGAYGGIGNA